MPFHISQVKFMTLQSQCPSCSKILNLKSKAAFGKRVACPKCKKPFVVEPFEEEEFYEDEDDGYDSYEDDYDDGYEEEEAAPRRGRESSGKRGSSKERDGRSRAKGGGKKSRGRKHGGMPAWAKGLMAGGGGVLVLALLIWAIMSLAGGGGNRAGKFNFAYLPSGSDAVMTIKPAAMWNAQLLTPVRNHPLVAAGLAQVKTQFPLDINDVESIVIAFPSFEINNPSAEPEALGVVHLTKPLTIPPALVKEADHNGKKYLDLGNGNAGWQPEPTVFVTGPVALVTAAMDRGKTDSGDTKRFNFANSDLQLVLVIAPEAGLDIFELAKRGNPLAQQLPGVDGKIKGFFMGMSMHSGVDAELGFDCKDSGQASVNAAQFNKDLTSAKQQLDAMMMLVPAEYSTLVRATVDSVSVTSSGSTITAKASIPSGISDVIAKAVNDLGGQFGNFQDFLPGLLPGGGGFNPEPGGPTGTQ